MGRCPLEERLDLIRRHHHQISADMVLASVNVANPPIKMHLGDEDCPAEIAQLCEAHCIDLASPDYANLLPDRPDMRLRLLSAILRLADVLDESRHRAPLEQADLLGMSVDSRLHWWRHYFTRDVTVEPDRNRITVWFEFPANKAEFYSNLIPALQMPWAERELAGHRAVLADNGLSWHLGWQIRPGPFKTLKKMRRENSS